MSQQDNSKQQSETINDGEERVQEGEKAIKAAKITDPKPADKKEQDSAKDAEKWRNEG